ncbi:hypothetical protein [Streptomyces sp. Ru87]|uniref:hypothetical protein n=1 Tax=Streptomyces sp. Ru87 TaxID=2044307 RepID=UPI000BF6802F|nr:hypothetical protein [Streptomyces sp. Ru87]PGH50821.1 hypothetical protein CRI70_09840 [Streptomyces sp. Ru87]
MVYLRALTSTARMIRHTSRLAAGLVPDDHVVLDAPGEQLAPVLSAAGLGDHRPAAALLAATREGCEWENRDRFATALARFAQSRSRWLDQWLSAAPYDPDALLLRAAVAVRGALRRTAREEPLRAAGPLVREAAEAAPHDPVPWRVALDRLRGLRASAADFTDCWEEATRRSPHHHGCHTAALRHLTARCGAGHRSGGTGAWPPEADPCLRFAERAASDALPGSLLRSLPAQAVLDHPGPLPGSRLDAAADLAIEMSDRYPAGDPWPAQARNVLVHLLIVRGRWEEALRQFRLIGPHATAFPWNTVSDDPLGQFLEMRDGTRIQVASTMPLWRRTQRTARPATRGR